MTNEPQHSQRLPAGNSLQTVVDESSTLPRAMPLTWVDRIFSRLEAFYGARLADAWKGCDVAAVKRVWSEELATYTADEVRRGLEACRGRDWPPTLPEFLKACRPPLDYEAEFLEAVEQMRLRDQGKDQWSSAVIYWAAVRMGRDLSQFPYLTIKGRWQSTVDAVKAEIASGALANMIPQRAVALPDSSGVTISKEKAKSHIDAIMAQLAKKMTAA